MLGRSPWQLIALSVFPICEGTKEEATGCLLQRFDETKSVTMVAPWRSIVAVEITF